jgi:predicted CXXCH cytochrome family protein
MRRTNVQPSPRSVHVPGDPPPTFGKVLPAASLLAGAALWLFLAAIPALADGGPHVSSVNNGSSVLSADSCAGCHRAHTANNAGLLVQSEEALCLSCHGSVGVGASTDVEIGVQFKVRNPVGGSEQDPSGTAVLGALRGGGFVTARIDSSAGTRAAYGTAGSNASFVAKVGALAAGEPVTSAHLQVGTSTFTPKLEAWGNSTSGDAPAFTLSCATCHNPHGNGQYRILNPIPSDGSGPLVEATANAYVTDDTANTSIVGIPGTDTRNYTIIQAKASGGRYLLAGEIILAQGAGTFTNRAGDYFHKSVPWNSTIGSRGTAFWDGPNGLPGTYTASSNSNPYETGAFNNQMNAWCSTCHSRYLNDESSGTYIATPGAPYEFRHTTSRNRACLTCHVSHGSNATMEANSFSANVEYPDGSTSASSRLLKVDNRGTCQLCHDPTRTVKVYGPNIGQNGNPWTGPTPAPLVP